MHMSSQLRLCSSLQFMRFLPCAFPLSHIKRFGTTAGSSEPSLTAASTEGTLNPPPSSGKTTNDPALTGLPQQDYLLPKSYYDTYSLIKVLTESGLTRAQAEAIHSTYKAVLKHRFCVLERNFVSQMEIDNDASLLRSKCQEIRLDLQILSNRLHLDMKSMNEKAMQDIQLLSEKLKDMTDVLTLDSNMRIHFYKGENQDEIQKIDSMLHKLNGNLKVLVSDIKTASESSRWKAIYSFALGFSSTFAIVMFIRFFFKSKYQTFPKPVKFEDITEPGLG